MLDKSPRLRFSDEELENRTVERAAERVERAADKADAAKSKLRREEDRAKAQGRKLRFGKKDTSGQTASPSRGTKPPSPGRAKKAGAAPPSKAATSAGATERQETAKGLLQILHRETTSLPEAS
ncbi:MAG: hypothetical protein LUC87_00810 [Clostridiales bacterium]|nr:hypothetical protein [Clostridiales bacterium]